MQQITRRFKKPRITGPNDGHTHGIHGAATEVTSTGQGGTPAQGPEGSAGGLQRGRVSRVLNVAGAVMGAINAAAPVFPPLQSLTGGLQYFIKNHQAYVTNMSDIKNLLYRLENLEQNFQKGPNKIHEDFVSKAPVERYLSASTISAELTGVVREIGEMVLDYQVIISLAHVEILLIDHRLPSNKLYMTKLDSKCCMMLELFEDDRHIIDSLTRASDANYLAEKHDLCLPGTRINILNQLEAWAEDPSAKTVFWLNGHAGSGKSTIAQSFCRRAFSDGKLGGSFFCSRDSEARSNLDMIFPTIAFQLACNFPSISCYIVEILKMRPDVAKESLNNQLQKLLIEPLEQQSSQSVVIVIDALDECKDREPSSIILSLLSRFIHRIPHVKWLITGRPEPSIRDGFCIPGLRPLTDTIILHEVPTSDINHDIRLFLETRLSDDFRNRRDLDLPTIWPPDDQVHTLTMKCNGLFIFASTAMQYMRLPYCSPVETLSNLCRTENTPSEQGALGLDKLYTTVLETGYSTAGTVIQVQIKAIIAAIVLMMDPIPVNDLAALLGFTVKTIIYRLSMLHAVLRVPTSTKNPILMHHKSFFDYITDDSRCTNSRFYINPSIEHRALAHHCLKLMNDCLKRNPCSLPRYALNADLELSERERRIGGGLVYACTFWVAHLTLSNISPSTLKLLEAFFQDHLIHWLEAMSLLDKFFVVAKLLADVSDTLTSRFEKEAEVRTLVQWADEGRKFSINFREAVELSACHIYHSALPLSPLESILYQSQSANLKSEVKCCYGRNPAWPPADAIFSIPNGAVSLCFSNTGKFLAIRTTDMVACSMVYDMTSGVLLDSIETYYGLSFSPDDTFAAYLYTPNKSDPSTTEVVLKELRTGARRTLTKRAMEKCRTLQSSCRSRLCSGCVIAEQWLCSVLQ
ncbi:hypothetical protein H0H93_002082 [Arthromyces matolae]|nr:hypothetical protein H0H93_002082 [Arthromyces matolae]